MESYPSEIACKADQAAQTRTFYQSLPAKPVVFGGTCVQITNGAPV
jgi:hypothetical protein